MCNPQWIDRQGSHRLSGSQAHMTYPLFRIWTPANQSANDTHANSCTSLLSKIPIIKHILLVGSTKLRSNNNLFSILWTSFWKILVFFQNLPTTIRVTWCSNNWYWSTKRVSYSQGNCYKLTPIPNSWLFILWLLFRDRSSNSGSGWLDYCIWVFPGCGRSTMRSFWSWDGRSVEKIRACRFNRLFASLFGQSYFGYPDLRSARQIVMIIYIIKIH